MFGLTITKAQQMYTNRPPVTVGFNVWQRQSGGYSHTLAGPTQHLYRKLGYEAVA